LLTVTYKICNAHNARQVGRIGGAGSVTGQG